jgi:hypothetical protein
MAKYGYRCSCGNFNLHRGDLTRKKYALEKQNHAATCPALAEELKKSREASLAGAKKK